jgi:hypothetical protein
MQSSLLSYVFNKIFRYLFFKKNMQQKELCADLVLIEKRICRYIFCVSNTAQIFTKLVQYKYNWSWIFVHCSNCLWGTAYIEGFVLKTELDQLKGEKGSRARQNGSYMHLAILCASFSIGIFCKLESWSSTCPSKFFGCSLHWLWLWPVIKS